MAMFAKLPFVAILLLSLSVLAACSSPTPLPTAIPSPSLTPLPPTPTPELGIPIEPLIVTSSAIWLYTWSPDNETLAYWMPEEGGGDHEPSLGETLPATLHFLNVATGRECQNPLITALDYFGPTFAWLPDGRIFTVIPPESEDGGQVLIGPPCGPEFTDITDRFPAPILSLVSEKPNLSVLVLRTPEGFLLYEPETQEVHRVDERVRDGYAGFRWSPNGTRLGISAFTSVATRRGATWVVNVESGEVEEEIPWESPYLGFGGISGPIWLTEDKFIIWLVGPAEEDLLVTMGQSVVPLADLVEELAGKECVEGSCSISVVTGAGIEGTSNYHITFENVFIEGERLGILIYHPENDTIEQLPYEYSEAISPDGRFLFLLRCRQLAEEQGCVGGLLFRPIDPPGTPLSPLPAGSYDPRFSSDAKKFAVSVYSGDGNSIERGVIYIFSLPDVQPIGIWNPEPYRSSSYGSWSPDSRRFALVGSLLDGQGNGLFIIEVP